MKVLIDADSCPVLKIATNLALQNGLHIVVVSDTSHSFNFDNSNITYVLVDKGFDNSDFALLSRANPNDIVITQDYGLASMCLAKCCKVINQNGLIYTNKNIDELLLRRHISKKLKTYGKNKKRTSFDDENFLKNFKKLMEDLQ